MKAFKIRVDQCSELKYRYKNVFLYQGMCIFMNVFEFE